MTSFVLLFCIGYVSELMAVGFFHPLLSVNVFIVQTEAQTKQQARLEAQVASKLKEKGLSSLSTNDVGVILDQVY